MASIVWADAFTTLQLHQWIEQNNRSTPMRTLHADDIERLYHARDLLIQDMQNSPSLDKNSFIGVILDDVGLPRPPAQAQMTFRTLLSKEQFQEANGDVIFIWSNAPASQINELQIALQQFRQNPLWRQLKAVQQNRVYSIPSYWIGSSILSAHAVIDDLFRYLLRPTTPDKIDQS